MKLDITSSNIQAVEQYNKHYQAVLAEAKVEADKRYASIRNNIPEPFGGDMAEVPNRVMAAIKVAKFNRARKQARKQANVRYNEVVESSIDQSVKSARDMALSDIRQELYAYGYSMTYLNRVAEPILLDLHRAYLLDRSTGFQMPVEMKLEGHMNAVLNNLRLGILPDNFMDKAHDYTITGRQNAYYAPVRRDIDKHFVSSEDDASKYALACKLARAQFFGEVNHGRMAHFTPKTAVPYATALSRLEQSPVYGHTETHRNGKNPYARLLSLHELNSMLQYEEIASTGRVEEVESEDIPSIDHMYEAYIDYGYDKSSDTRKRLLSTMPSAIQLADSGNIRVADMRKNVQTLMRARDYESRNDFMCD